MQQLQHPQLEPLKQRGCVHACLDGEAGGGLHSGEALVQRRVGGEGAARAQGDSRVRLQPV